MNPHHTLLIIKPDAYKRDLLVSILFILHERTRVARIETRRLSDDDVMFLYGKYAKEPFYDKLRQFMVSDLSILVELVGNHAVSRVRKMVGESKTHMRRGGFYYTTGSVRWMYASQTVKRRNAVHCSDTTANAMKELAHFFPKE